MSPQGAMATGSRGASATSSPGTRARALLSEDGSASHVPRFAAWPPHRKGRRPPVANVTMSPSPRSLHFGAVCHGDGLTQNREVPPADILSDVGDNRCDSSVDPTMSVKRIVIGELRLSAARPLRRSRGRSGLLEARPDGLRFAPGWGIAGALANTGVVEAGETMAATFLFTDLVGSTEMASGMSASDAEGLRQTHFGLLRGAIDAAGGREVKNLGDGLMVVFLSPSRALACAVGMQQAIERHNRRAALHLGVRIGLSIGEAVEEDADFFGDPVVEAARLFARAMGGQILASALLPLTLGRRATQEFAPVGDLELKGLPEPVSTVEVVWEPSAEEAVGTVVPLPGRLASTAASGLFGFSGRSVELEGLEDARKRSVSEARLQVVLIAGEPGVGKTSLAAQGARTAHGEGVTVLFGACPEGTSAPYQPWISALSHLVRHSPAELLGGLERGPRRGTASPPAGRWRPAAGRNDGGGGRRYRAIPTHGCCRASFSACICSCCGSRRRRRPPLGGRGQLGAASAPDCVLRTPADVGPGDVPRQ